MKQATSTPTHGESIPDGPPNASRTRWWLRLGAYVVLAYIAWCAALYFYQDQLVFPKDMAPSAPAAFPAVSDRTVTLRVAIDDGGQVEAFFLPVPGASAEQPAPVVVFCHGNAEVVDGQCDLAIAYQRLGCSVLLPEYRGYGRSAGKPSEEGIVADAVRFYDLICERDDVDASRIVIHGRSLGGGVAAQLAARRKPAALILESTFTSVAIMAHDYFAPTFLARHPFRTDRVVASLDIPLLIFHGRRDEVIPVEHGQRLRDLAHGATYIEYDCGHHDFPGPANYEAYWNQIETFLRAAGVID